MDDVEILVLDFGSQYTQLIARRLREFGVYTQIVPYFEDIESIISKNPKGLILSGGPSSVYQNNAYKPNSDIFNLNIPILGICYGMQYIADYFGGKVVKASSQEFGKATLEILDYAIDKNNIIKNNEEYIINTQRTYIRKFNQKDFYELNEYLGNDEIMYAWNGEFSKQEIQAWLDRQLKSYENYGFGVWAAIDKKSKKLIGSIGLNYEYISKDGINKEKIIEISFILNKDCWNKGYALECVTACKEYAFNALNIDKVYCLIRNDNFTSFKVAKKMGMNLIGENIKNKSDINNIELIFMIQNVSNQLKNTSIIQNYKHKIFNNVKQNSIVWMSHADKIEILPKDFIAIARSENTKYCAIVNKNIYALQFHPEVIHTECGKQILKNFAIDICNCNTDWNMYNFAESQIIKLKNKINNNNVICAVSGGVDSSVVATLLHNAIKDQLIPIFVDTGLLRKDERESVEKMFKEDLKIPLITIDASEIFLKKLKGIIDPESKRKIIGETFIEVFQNEAKKYNENSEIKFLAQGTLYPDVIESISIKGPSKTIKSHHNVSGLPSWMKFELIEPLRELFKDEVRKLGKELGIPESMLFRHPFPGPGLGIRIIGEINKNDLDILKKADSIFIEELHKHNLYNKVWQAFCVLLNVKSVGVMGDNRTYYNTICIRAVESIDGMTANFSHLPHSFLEDVTNRIINEVSGINRVVYDITGKPPGTIEWE